MIVKIGATTDALIDGHSLSAEHRKKLSFIESIDASSGHELDTYCHIDLKVNGRYRELTTSVFRSLFIDKAFDALQAGHSNLVLGKQSYRVRSIDATKNDVVETFIEIMNSLPSHMIVYIDALTLNKKKLSFTEMATICETVNVLSEDGAAELMPILDIYEGCDSRNLLSPPRVLESTDFVRLSRNVDRGPFKESEMEVSLNYVRRLYEKCRSDRLSTLNVSYDENNKRSENNQGLSRFISWAERNLRL